METNIQTKSIGFTSQEELPASHDYRNALIVGIISAIFLLPVQHKLLPDGKYAFVPESSFLTPIIIFGVPLLCLAAIFAGKLLFRRFSGLWQFVKFALIGISNTIIDFGILNFLVSLTGYNKGIIVAIFGAIAFIGATINSYIWNSHWSFQNENYRTPEELIKFLSVTITGLLLKSLIIYLATTLYQPDSSNGDIILNIANLGSVIVTLIWNFFGYKFFVFKFDKKQA